MTPNSPQVALLIGSSGLTINPDISIAAANTIDKKTYQVAIANLNKSNNWTRYNEAIYDYLDDHPQNCYLAYQEGHIVGYAIYKPERNMLSYIAVADDHKGSKIGFTLFDRIMEAARKADKKVIQWDYRDQPSGPGQFYDKLLKELPDLKAEKIAAGCYLDGTPKISISLCLR